MQRQLKKDIILARNNYSFKKRQKELAKKKKQEEKRQRKLEKKKDQLQDNSDNPETLDKTELEESHL